MSFALTFGSVGDFLTLIGLGIKAVQALLDGAGSTSEYQDLIAELVALSSVLGLVHSRFTPQHRLRPDVVNAIDFEISGCRSVINKFLKSVKGYEKALGSAGRHGSLRKIAWKILKPDDVATLRAKLAAHRGTIDMLVNVIILCVQLLFTRKRSRQYPPVSPHTATKSTVRV